MRNNLMRDNQKWVLSLIIAGNAIASPLSFAASHCQIIYDAGSSGTRLYIYQQQGEDWIAHPGPTAAALADPVRGIRGKSWCDVNAVVNEVVGSLERIKQNGPLDDDGKPQWSAFDWSTQCQLDSARVLATAGMRIAEQSERKKSAKLWKKLKAKLRKEVGDDVMIDTRTLTGYEEGLYAWMSVRQTQPNNRLGIVEMGGASSQVTFHCPDCKAAETIIVNGKPVSIYSYSFLGLGQDEAPKPQALGMTPSCAYGVGLEDDNWTVNSCAADIHIKFAEGIVDPYNVGPNGYGTYNDIPTDKADVVNWVLTGAFQYTSHNDINNCCLDKGNCYQEQTACFRAVYLPKYLKVLNVCSSQKVDSSWTYGATLCGATDCLRDSGQLQCRWSEKGCLK